MHIAAVSDERDVLAGLHLAGIEGVFVSDVKSVEFEVARLREDKSCAILLVTESCAARIPETVRELKLSASAPLLVVIPSPSQSERSGESITALIREAIGLKV